jgi:lysophospholipase L1-like esterase
VIFILFLFGAASGQSGAAANDCTNRGKKVFSELPLRVGNFQKADGFKTYSGDSLFDYINGNAHWFFDKGFKCLNVQEYRNTRQVLLLELYLFDSRDGARSIYTDETDGSLNKGNIGEESSFEDGYLAFYYKRYFVKLICFDDRHRSGSVDESENIDSNATIEKLARSIEAVLINQVEEHLASNEKGKIAGQKSNKKDSYIVLIGASYAKGWDLGEVDGMRVINKGMSGEQSFEMLSRFEEDVLSVKPKSVIIWGFINDIFWSERQNMDATLERIKTNFEKMVKLSRDNGIIPILATEVTVRPETSWKETIAGWVGGLLGKESYQDYINQHVLDINKWIRDYAEKHDLLLLDLQPVIADENGQRKKEYAVKDGSHISEEGYEKLTEYANSVLQQYFKD